MQTTAVCKICNQEKPVASFQLEDGRVRRNICWPCRGKRERAQQKLSMLEAFGYKCMCCGEDNPLFLTLDHVKNDGAEHRKTMPASHQSYYLAKKEGWPKDKWQLLCMNCNFAKGHYGECPHKTGRTTDIVLEELRNAAQLVARGYVLTETQKTALALGPGSQQHKDAMFVRGLLGQMPLGEVLKLIKEMLKK